MCPAQSNATQGSGDGGWWVSWRWCDNQCVRLTECLTFYLLILYKRWWWWWWGYCKFQVLLPWPKFERRHGSSCHRLEVQPQSKHFLCLPFLTWGGVSMENTPTLQNKTIKPDPNWYHLQLLFLANRRWFPYLHANQRQKKNHWICYRKTADVSASLKVFAVDPSRLYCSPDLPEGWESIMS